MTAEFEFYRSTFCGEKIPEAEFGKWSRRAANMLSAWVCEGAPESDNMRLCICDIAEYLYENADRNGVVREENDGYGVTYSSEQTGGAYDIARQWLLADGVLYRGDIVG